MSGFDEDFSERAQEAELATERILDPGAAERRQEEDRDRLRAKAQRKAWLIGMMQHPEGRLWLKEVLDRFHTFETRFASVNGVADHPAGTWMFAGEQKSGWWLWEQLDDADPVIASRLRRGA